MTWTRIEHMILDDPQYADVYASDQLLAAWLRLRLQADISWPNSAPVPRGCRKAALGQLVELGLVTLIQGDRYRLPALDEEREARTLQAADAGRRRAKNAPRAAGRFTSGVPANHQRPLAGEPATKPHTTRPDPTKPVPDTSAVGSRVLDALPTSNGQYGPSRTFRQLMGGSFEQIVEGVVEAARRGQSDS